MLPGPSQGLSPGARVSIEQGPASGQSARTSAATVLGDTVSITYVGDDLGAGTAGPHW